MREIKMASDDEDAELAKLRFAALASLLEKGNKLKNTSTTTSVNNSPIPIVKPVEPDVVTVPVQSVLSTTQLQQPQLQNVRPQPRNKMNRGNLVMIRTVPEKEDESQNGKGSLKKLTNKSGTADGKPVNKFLLRPQDKWAGTSSDSDKAPASPAKPKGSDKFSRYESSNSESDEDEFEMQLDTQEQSDNELDVELAAEPDVAADENEDNIVPNDVPSLQESSRESSPASSRASSPHQQSSKFSSRASLSSRSSRSDRSSSSRSPSPVEHSLDISGDAEKKVVPKLDSSRERSRTPSLDRLSLKTEKVPSISPERKSRSQSPSKSNTDSTIPVLTKETEPPVHIQNSSKRSESPADVVKERSSSPRDSRKSIERKDSGKSANLSQGSDRNRDGRKSAYERENDRHHRRERKDRHSNRSDSSSRRKHSKPDDDTRLEARKRRFGLDTQETSCASRDKSRKNSVDRNTKSRKSASSSAENRGDKNIEKEENTVDSDSPASLSPFSDSDSEDDTAAPWRYKHTGEKAGDSRRPGKVVFERKSLDIAQAKKIREMDERTRNRTQRETYSRNEKSRPGARDGDRSERRKKFESASSEEEETVGGPKPVVRSFLKIVTKGRQTGDSDDSRDKEVKPTSRRGQHGKFNISTTGSDRKSKSSREVPIHEGARSVLSRLEKRRKSASDSSSDSFSEAESESVSRKSPTFSVTFSSEQHTERKGKKQKKSKNDRSVEAEEVAVEPRLSVHQRLGLPVRAQNVPALMSLSTSREDSTSVKHRIKRRNDIEMDDAKYGKQEREAKHRETESVERHTKHKRKRKRRKREKEQSKESEEDSNSEAELDAHIKKMKEKNVAIMKRLKEIEADKERFSK